MLGQLQAVSAERVVSRFRTEKTGALLAYLAYHNERSHPREELIGLFWPDRDAVHGSMSLRTALTSLRRQLEPPGTPAGSVVLTDVTSVRLNPDSLSTDVLEFNSALQASSRAESLTDRMAQLERALDLYAGPLLPAYYDAWIQSERDRLSEAYLIGTWQMVRHSVQAKDLKTALDFAIRAVQADPTREESHRDLMRLYVATGQTGAAVRQFRELERVLKDEIGCEHSAATRQLAREIASNLRKLAADRSQEGSVPESRPVLESFSRECRQGDLSRPSYPSRPTGTVTFLSLDVERSANLIRRSPDAYKRALGKYLEIARNELEHAGGFEVKAAGDSVQAVFAGATDALACAISIQKAIGAAEWPEELGSFSVRTALNTGDVEFEKGQYRGPLLVRAARLQTAAHGGQILCSETTASVLQRDLDPGLQLLDIGLYRLRDLSAPEHLFQVTYPEVDGVQFPAPNAEAGYAGNIPAQYTRFFGREAEIEWLVDCLAPAERDETAVAPRLYTLTGPGGTGKTRLSIEAANRLLGAYNGAVWFVPLAGYTDARFIGGAIVDAMRLSRAPGQDPLDQAIDALALQPSLLVLDNFEQIADEGAQIVGALLDRATTLRILVTSRSLLRLVAEREYPLSSLKTPTASDMPERLISYEAVRLFVDRAQMAKPDFQLTARNASAVAELCSGIEGIPLAIEPAAARAQFLTPAQMVEQLRNRFAFLVSRKRDVEERHRTLRGAIDWSVKLLSPALQNLFAGLSVFRGGWTIESAKAVCLRVGDSLDCADALAQLRDCSLIQPHEVGGEMRFRMMETLRQYAGELLEAQTDKCDLELAHLRYYREFVEEAATHTSGPDQQIWLDRIESEHDNIRAALEANLRIHGTCDDGLGICGGLFRFWDSRGYWSEGRRCCKEMLGLTATSAQTTLRSSVLHVAGMLAYRQGDSSSARTLFEESLEIGQVLGERNIIAQALLGLGNVSQDLGDYTGALGYHERSLCIKREMGDPAGIAAALNNLGVVVLDLGDYSAARAYLEECLALSRELDDRRLTAYSMTNLARVAARSGELDEATRQYRIVLPMVQEIGDQWGIAIVLNELAGVAYEQKDYKTAREHYNAGLRLVRELGDRSGEGVSLHGLALLAFEEHDHQAALSLFKESLLIRREIADQPRIASLLEAIAALRSRATPCAAARLWGAAERILEQTAAPRPRPEEARHRRNVAAARASLADATAFEEAWRNGRKMTTEQAINAALDPLS